jgi:hypothetical protein
MSAHGFHECGCANPMDHANDDDFRQRTPPNPSRATCIQSTNNGDAHDDEVRM